MRGGDRVAPRARHRPLTARLRPHVAGELDGAAYEWWTPPGRHRTAELARLVEHLACLAGVGCGLGAAIDRVARDRDGMAAAELAVVAEQIRDGQPPARALRHWAMTGGGDAAARLAAVAGAAAPEELARHLAALAAELGERAHDERLAATQRSARLAWIASVLGLVAAITAALS